MSHSKSAFADDAGGAAGAGGFAASGAAAEAGADAFAAGGAAVGCVHDDLRHAALTALAHGDRAACRAYAETFTWRACAERFVTNLVPIRHGMELAVSYAGD